MGECVTVSVALSVSDGGVFSRVGSMQSGAAELKAGKQLPIP